MPGGPGYSTGNAKSVKSSRPKLEEAYSKSAISSRSFNEAGFDEKGRSDSAENANRILRGPLPNPRVEGATMTPRSTPAIGSFRKGGRVRKTGAYRVHKGERILSRRSTKR
jgi:hypothetical protein